MICGVCHAGIHFSCCGQQFNFLCKGQRAVEHSFLLSHQVTKNRVTQYIMSSPTILCNLLKQEDL